jgi:hypothetical protein
MEIKPFAPGSKEAIKCGCCCPVEKNNAGAGAFLKENGIPVFWFDRNCPIHGKADEIESETKLHEI